VSLLRLMMIALSLAVAAYLGGFACFRHLHTMRHNTGPGGPDSFSTTFQITGFVSRVACFALIPAMTADRLLTGRDTVIIDRESYDSYFLSEHLPPLTADPTAPGHC